MCSPLKKYSKLIILASLALAFLALRPILNSSWYPMHDSTHLGRVTLMKETILAGQFPPIWASEINSGYGYPLFHFYAPLFHYLATFFSFIFPLVISLKLTLFLTVFVGILGVMLYARRWGRGSALVAGLAFALAPYLASDIYVRGAYSELLSISLIPWLLITLKDLVDRKSIIIASITLSLFVLSHNLIPLLALPFITLYLIYFNRNNLRAIVSTIALSLGLSSWFIIPLLFERSFTQADNIARTTSYFLHYVEPWQLWNSTWGFGGSAPGVEDGMSFKLGKLQLIMGILASIFAWLRRRSEAIFLTIVLAVSLFISTSYSSWIWDNLAYLQIVQFPWRSLGISTLALSLLAGYLFSILPRLIKFIALPIITIAFFITGLKYFSPQEILSADYSSEQDLARIVPEYLPAWMPDFPTKQASSSYELAYYPTWRATYRGQALPLSPNESGLIKLDDSLDLTQLELYQSHTTLERISYLLTILSFFVALIYWRKNE